MIKSIFLIRNVSHCNSQTQYQIIYRYVRNISRHEVGTKLLKGKIKTTNDGTTQYQRNPSTYGDFVKDCKINHSQSILDIEKDFALDAEYGGALEKSEEFYQMHLSEGLCQKSMIKKSIIGRKYFKMRKETNLLTYAAKEQIRYLHKTNPTEWTPEQISETFPISLEGVKKLLKSNFEIKSPERIKQHDDDVARKWEILKSGKDSPEIFPLTKKLWEEGKLLEDNFSGNPRLPSAPLLKTIVRERKVYHGEFSSIIKKYVDYKQKTSNKNVTENQVCERKEIRKQFANKENDYLSKLKHAAEEMDDGDFPPEFSNKNKKLDEVEMSFSHFKEDLMQKRSRRQNSDIDNEYQEWVEQQSRKIESIPAKNQYSENIFTKIQKHEKQNQGMPHEPLHEDNRFRFQYPQEKVAKSRIHIPRKFYKKGKTIKVGECIYDDKGDLLFKLPS